MRMMVLGAMRYCSIYSTMVGVVWSRVYAEKRPYLHNGDQETYPWRSYCMQTFSFISVRQI